MSTRDVVALVLGGLGLAIIAAAVLIIVTGHDLPPGGAGNAVAILIGALLLVAGIGVASDLTVDRGR